MKYEVAVSPDKRRKATKKAISKPKSGPSPDDAFDVQYFATLSAGGQRSAPARAEMEGWPVEVLAAARTTIANVAGAPPPRYRGGGRWKVMHGDMAGFYEVRHRHSKTLYRVFCVLDSEAMDPDDPTKPYGKNVLAIIDATTKPNQTAVPPATYRRVRRHRTEYLSQNPRSWL